MSYEIKEPNAPMTYKQGIMIRNLGGGDVREQNLTRQQASNRIGELMEAKKDNIKTSKTVQINYDDLWAKATAAGLEAGTAAIPVPMTVQRHANPLDDNSPVVQNWHVGEGACGFADVNFKMKDGLGRKFGQWLIRNDFARKDSYRGGCTIWISDHGQSVERKAAHAAAIAKVLQEAGIDAYASSRLD